MSNPQTVTGAVELDPEPCWKATVLSIIDKLRERKARPDVERIFIMASRQQESADLTRDVIAHILQQLVDEQLVLPVEYKGSVSYRNVTSWRRRKEVAGGRNSPDTSRRVLSAAQSLQGGSFTAQLVHSRLLAAPDSQQAPMSPSALSEALEREAAAGRLFRVGPGRFQLDLDGSKRQAALHRRKERLQLAKRARLTAAAADAEAVSAAKRAVPSSSRPFAYVAAGPLDLSSSRRAQLPVAMATTPDTISCGSGGSSDSVDRPVAASAAAAAAATSSAELCDFCLSPSTANRMGVPEHLLRCLDCTHRAHPSCMLYGPDLASRASRSPWQCSECKTCCICSGSGDPELMLICDSCDKGYHLSCHRPNVTTRPATDAKWVCSRCQSEDASQCQQQPPQPPKAVDEAAHSTQDASRWTIAQVRTWLNDEGFPLAAQAFVEQEIDGASLMLMKRMDVLTGLGLKLGPAVKVFEKISRLQCRSRTLLQVK